MSWNEFYKAIQEAYQTEDEATVKKYPLKTSLKLPRKN